MVKLAKWAFWNLYYLTQKQPDDLGEYVTRVMRTTWPWRKFIANAWHNDTGKMWQVHLTEESYCVKRMTIEVEAYIGQETGEIVGFNLWDENTRLSPEARAA